MAKVIPYRGSWVEFEYDQKNILYVRIDRKRKFPATVFLRALGFEDDATILRAFYTAATVKADGGKFLVKADAGAVNKKVRQPVAHPRSGDEILKKGRRVKAEQLEDLRKAKIEWIPIETSEMDGAHTIRDLADPATGEVLVEVGKPLTDEGLERLLGAGVDTFDVCFPEKEDVGGVLLETSPKTPSRRKTMRCSRSTAAAAGDPPTLDSSRNLFNGLFFDPTRYDFSKVGRLKFNTKLYGMFEKDWPAEVHDRWRRARTARPRARTSSRSFVTCSS